MTAVCRKLQSDFSRVQPAILMLQAVWAALLGVLLVARLSMSTAMYHYSYSDDSDYSKIYDLEIPLRGVYTAYLALAVAGLLVASASMLKALFSAPAYLRKGVRSLYKLPQSISNNPSCRLSQNGSPSLPSLPSATPQPFSAPTSNPRTSYQEYPRPRAKRAISTASRPVVS